MGLRLQDLLFRVTPPREIIGPAECPLMHRWTLINTAAFKLLLHHFLPYRTDADHHDHPRPFITVVLRGSYEDVQPCPVCRGDGTEEVAIGEGCVVFVQVRCSRCAGDGNIIAERLKAPAVRRRLAHHTHRTLTGAEHCWTLVLMGPIRRKRWGFLHDGVWWYYADYLREFGANITRCGD